MRLGNRLHFRAATATLAVFAMLLFTARARAIDITVRSAVVGQTPEIVGYNSGHFLPGSNTADWWRYSGVNGARVWSTPSVVEPGDDSGSWGDGINSQASFMSRRAALRANPLSTSFINWPYFESRFENNATTGNNIRLNYAFGELKNMGLESVAVLHATEAGMPFSPAGTPSGWADRWEYWQHFYAQAFHLARHYDVERFDMYNEPDHSSNSGLSQIEYIERLQFASDAVHSAVRDVNTQFGKNLVPQVQAPVTAGGSNKFLPNPGGDPRDELIGWGELAIENRHTNFLGTIDGNINLFQTYAYQQYNLTGPGFGSELATIKSLVDQASGGEDLRFAITEFNVHTAATFATLSETLDTPSKSARFGAILANVAANQPDELYVFKFSQTDNTDDGSVKKNGTHYVDNNSVPHNIGGVTKGGEVVRLFAKGFAGANELFSGPAVRNGGSDFHVTSAYNADDDRYFVFAANEAAVERPLAIDLVNWHIQPGARVIVEEVSSTRHGEVSHILTVPQNRVLNFSQAAQSVVLLSVPKAAASRHITIAASDDATVSAGTDSAANFGNSPELFAKNDPADAAARSVSLLKFNTSDAGSSGIDQAILQLHGQNTGTAGQVIAHVYGILDDQWDESTINWQNAPNLAEAAGVVNDISHNFVEGAGQSAFFVGHLTGIGASRELAIDVTNFVRGHPDKEITFLIAREVRFDGENVDDGLGALRLTSKEHAFLPGPQLLLSLTDTPGDYNNDGIVNADDYATWRQTFGSGGNPAADGNGDGVVDAADYVVWRRSMAASAAGLPAAAFAITAAVPEPSGALLGCVGFLTIWLARVAN